MTAQKKRRRSGAAPYQPWVALNPNPGTRLPYELEGGLDEALKAVESAKAATPTPATGGAVPAIGECNCPGSIHLDDCSHYVAVSLAQVAEHPCVEIDWFDEDQAYECGCGKFSSPSLVDVEIHQRGAK